MDSITTIAFVDPIISPVYLAEMLRLSQIKTVAIFSLKLSAEEKKLRMRPEVFDEVIYCDENTDLVIVAEQLKKLKVQYVFYGYEASVKFTDLLAKLVCPAFANDPATAQYRNDKYEMQEALKRQHIPAVKQIKINKNSLMDHKIELQQWNFPIIVKPIHGSVSIGVKKCHSTLEIEEFLKTQEETLLHAVAAEEYVVQECLEGKECFVDTFSLAGKHYVVSVQYYEKTYYKDYPVYRYIGIVDPQTKEWQICCDYVLKVLAAVGLKNGFGHTELFLTAQGPRLIEVNPRISGTSGFTNKLAEQTLHVNQPQALVNVIAKLPYHAPNKLFATGRIAMLQNWESRKIGELNIALLQTLPSYIEHLVFKKAGAQLDSPKTLLDTVALVLLINKDETQLNKDYERLIAWEKAHELF